MIYLPYRVNTMFAENAFKNVVKHLQQNCKHFADNILYAFSGLNKLVTIELVNFCPDNNHAKSQNLMIAIFLCYV